MVWTLKKKWSAIDPGLAPAIPPTAAYANPNARFRRRKTPLRARMSSHQGACRR